MGFPSAWAEGRPSIYGPANVWALSVWGILAEGRLVAGPFLFKVPGSGRLAMGVGPRPKVPTMPPFFYQGGKPSPIGKRVSLTAISWGIVYY